MKVSREQMAANRERILEIASRLFRERGFEDVSVAEVMQLAGLTHGGFYGHFPSKEALAAEAASHALARTVTRWNGTLAKDGQDGLQRIVDAYLSARHRDHPGAGCVIAALGGDVPRQGTKMQEAFGREVSKLVDTVIPFMPAKSQEQKRDQALALLAQLVGAIVLARAFGRDAMSEEILHAVRVAVAHGASRAAA